MNNHEQFSYDHSFATPEEIARPPEQPPVLGPTFTEPDMAMPALQAGDPQSGAGMDYVYDAELERVLHNALDADPLLPSMQHPTIEPEVSMMTRPGDLDPQALQVLHDDMTYRQLDGEMYPMVYMDANGMNSRRRRDFTLLVRGLDAEEQKHGEEL